MADFFDTVQVRDDPEHWDARAARVAADAARDSRARAFQWVSHSRASGVAALLLLAAALALMESTIPIDSSSKSRLGPEWAGALAPADDVGRSIMLSESPPPLSALLLAGRGGVMR